MVVDDDVVGRGGIDGSVSSAVKPDRRRGIG
jgi:hypothetical protein